MVKKITTATGRELTFPEFKLEARAVSSGWPVSDEIKADVVETCHKLVTEGNDREAAKGASILAALEKQNIDIAKEMRRQNEASAITLVQNNLNMDEVDQLKLYEMMTAILGGTSPTEETHVPVPKIAGEQSDGVMP